jgi:hypothetical protein
MRSWPIIWQTSVTSHGDALNAQLTDHVTNQCHRKERSSDVRCVLCGGNRLENYKGCTIYKELQKGAYQPLWVKPYTPPAQIKPINSTEITCAQITQQNSYASTNIEQESHRNKSRQQTSDMQDLKHTMNSLFGQMWTMLNLLTAVLPKL